MDTLATAPYVTTDDLLRQYPDLAPWRPVIGLQPRLTDAELVTLAVMQALLGYPSEAWWFRSAHAHLGHLLGYLPGQSGYNRRLRAAALAEPGTTSPREAAGGEGRGVLSVHPAGRR